MPSQSLLARRASGVVIALLALALTASPAIAADEPAPSSTSGAADPNEVTTVEPLASDELGGTWRRIPAAPFGAVDVPGGWTGTELVVVDPERRRRAAAYYPALDRWDEIARPPRRIAPGSPAHWTGAELIFVESRGAAKRGLAAYDPVADAWRDTAPAPFNDITASTWADGVLVAVSGVDGRAATYEPTTDAWSALPSFPAAAATVSPPAGPPRSLHAAADRVFAFSAASDGGPNPTDAVAQLALTVLDLEERSWGTSSAGPLAAASSDPVWTGDAFVFLTPPHPDVPAEALPRDGTYDPATDTWTVIENACSLDTAEALWAGSAIVDVHGRRALEPATGRCYDIPLPPWPGRKRGLLAWTGDEIIEYSGRTTKQSPARRDGLAYEPFPREGALGVAVDVPARPVRIRFPSLGIDLPVISSEREVPGSTPGYPACDVALYWTYFDLPGEPGTTWILAHSQAGMFLPLLQAVRSKGRDSLVGKRVEVQLGDGRLLTYRTYRVKPRAGTTDLRIARARMRDGEQRLVLQTSTGIGSAPKLQVAARLVDVGTTDVPRPRARPRACG